MVAALPGGAAASPSRRARHDDDDDATLASRVALRYARPQRGATEQCSDRME
jgi:hypothetical protein